MDGGAPGEEGGLRLVEGARAPGNEGKERLEDVSKRLKIWGRSCVNSIFF